MTPCRILLAEDDAACRDMLAAFLELHGHVVLTATDGAEAIASALEFHPDVVLTDLCMPRVSGVELCRQLRHDPATQCIPVVAMTALSLDGWQDFQPADFEDVLCKPFELDDLERRVRAACDPNHKRNH